MAIFASPSITLAARFRDQRDCFVVIKEEIAGLGALAKIS
jgi:hypothetical protein